MVMYGTVESRERILTLQTLGRLFVHNAGLKISCALKTNGRFWRDDGTAANYQTESLHWYDGPVLFLLHVLLAFDSSPTKKESKCIFPHYLSSG